MGSEDRDMEEDEGYGFWIWGVAEVVNVSIWAETTDDGGAGWGVNGLTLRADGDFGVVADADAGLLTPDERPPRTSRDGAELGAVFDERLLAGRVRSGLQFAMDFVLVGVGDELVEQVVGPDQFNDGLGSQEWDKAFLPVVVTAFDFPFRVGCALHPMRTSNNNSSPLLIPFTLGAAGASS